MKNYKISGEKIGNLVNLSQKTISRYACQESMPSETTQNKIMDALRQLGVPEKEILILKDNNVRGAREAKRLYEFLDGAEEDWEIWDENEPDYWEITKQNAYNILKRIFLIFPLPLQQFIVQHMDYYCTLTMDDILFLSDINQYLTARQQEFVMEQLEHIRFHGKPPKKLDEKKVQMHIEMVKQEHIPLPNRLDEKLMWFREQYDAIQWSGHIFKDLVEYFQKLLPLDSPTETSPEWENFISVFQTCDDYQQQEMAYFFPEIFFLGEEDIYKLYLLQLNALADQTSSRNADRPYGEKVWMLRQYVTTCKEQNSKAP